MGRTVGYFEMTTSYASRKMHVHYLVDDVNPCAPSRQRRATVGEDGLTTARMELAIRSTMEEDAKLAKDDYPPILKPGIHHMTIDTIRDVFVSPLPEATSRLRTFSLFDQWVSRLRQLNVTGTLWVDGSFVTRKPNPSDVDCVFWNPSFVAPISEEGKIEVRSMTDRASARAMFGVDLYIETPLPEQKMAREAYWRGMFGFQHDGKSAKGFV